MMRAFSGITTSAVLLITLAHPPVVQADDEDVIAYRQHIMQALHHQAAILGQIVSYAVPNDHVIEHLEALSLLASTALKSFEEEVQGGDARPEVWEDWEDFSARMNEFAEKTAAATENAKVNGKDAALVNILDVLSCKGCHEDYREEPE
jgi:cytochrome c556